MAIFEEEDSDVQISRDTQTDKSASGTDFILVQYVTAKVKSHLCYNTNITLPLQLFSNITFEKSWKYVSPPHRHPDFSV